LQASLHSVHSTAQRDGHMSARVMTLYGEGLLVVVTSEVDICGCVWFVEFAMLRR